MKVSVDTCMAILRGYAFVDEEVQSIIESFKALILSGERYLDVPSAIKRLLFELHQFPSCDALCTRLEEVIDQTIFLFPTKQEILIILHDYLRKISSQEIRYTVYQAITITQRAPDYRYQPIVTAIHAILNAVAIEVSNAHSYETYTETHILSWCIKQLLNELNAAEEEILHIVCV